MKIIYKGYVIIQSNYNYHITIYKNNEMVMHLSTTEKFTENQLKELVNFYFKEEINEKN